MCLKVTREEADGTSMHRKNDKSFISIKNKNKHHNQPNNKKTKAKLTILQ